MSRLFDAYRAGHEQGFLPIFVQDDFDSKMLIEACVKAGCKCIEYTLRRPDAHKMIPWIRENYPDLYLLVGSTLDNENIVVKARKRHPQLLSLAELSAMGIDGFVSMIGWSLESIRKYSPRCVVAVSAMTVTEAFQQVGAGAHFIKVLGSDLNLVKRCRSDAAFGYCPILVTGGMTPHRIPEAIEAGAIIVASGFDLILKGQPSDISCTKAAELLSVYLNATRQAREKYWPEMTRAIGTDKQAWLDSLPHHHPF